jgi:hypothetical protein
MPAQSLSEAQTLASQAVAHCTDASQCSPAVGMLVSTSSSSAVQCTAFLISSNIVATNSHCIPDDLKAAGSACQERIALIFPEVGNYPAVKTGCTQVISASTIDSTFKNPDYAFVRLDANVSRPILQITHSGLADNGIYQLDKIDPYQGNGIPEGYLHQVQCKAIYGSLVTGGAASAQAPVMAMGDCAVVEGNSGSPLIDSNGNVPAVIFATINDATLTTLLSKDSNSGADQLDDSFAALGLATDYSCLSVPTDAADSDALPAACQTPVNSTANAATSGITAEASAEIQKDFNAAAPSLPPSMQWTTALIQGKEVNELGLFESDPNAILVIAVPKCIADKDSFLASEERKWFGNYDQKSVKSISLPIWSIDVGLNRYAQIGYRIEEAAAGIESSMMIQFDPQQVYKQGQTALIVSDALDLQNGTPLYTGTLALCKGSPSH